MHVENNDMYLPQRGDISKLTPPRYTQQILCEFIKRTPPPTKSWTKQARPFKHENVPHLPVMER
jgi:hypothetical protein